MCRLVPHVPAVCPMYRLCASGANVPFHDPCAGCVPHVPAVCPMYRLCAWGTGGAPGVPVRRPMCRPVVHGPPGGGQCDLYSVTGHTRLQRRFLPERAGRRHWVERGQPAARPRSQRAAAAAPLMNGGTPGGNGAFLPPRQRRCAESGAAADTAR